ncbi:MAG: ClpXP protease specificity-enhancing factor SspB [Methylocella sp.]
MAIDLIRYDVLVQDAMRGVVRKVLGDMARDGLAGEHHFYITFRTHARGVRLSTRMREIYPDEMTIILQHQFWDLNVTDQAFEVGLSFKNIPEMLLIPFDALTRFSDPAVGFDLKFEIEDEAETSANDAGKPLGPTLASVTSDAPQPLRPPALSSVETAKPRNEPAPASAAETAGDDSPPEPNDKVVSIDAFRKKP